MKRLISIVAFCIIILSLTACGQETETEKKTTPLDSVIGDASHAYITGTSDPTASDTEIPAETSAPDISETQSTSTDTGNTPINNSPANNTGGTGSKPTNPPTSSTPSQSTSTPPATSTPTQSQPPATSTPTPSTPAPEYEIMGQEYLSGVLKGMNDRRAALGFPLATLNNVLSNECLVQAKKMADAGYDFHSEHPSGCEGTAKVPYNFPAELMGDMMCNHVADFTYEATTKIGIAVVKKNNSLFVVVIGTA